MPLVFEGSTALAFVAKQAQIIRRVNITVVSFTQVKEKTFKLPVSIRKQKELETFQVTELLSGDKSF